MHKTNYSVVLTSNVLLTRIIKIFYFFTALMILVTITLAQQFIRPFCVFLLIKVAFFNKIEHDFSKLHLLHSYEISKALKFLLLSVLLSVKSSSSRWPRKEKI